MPIKRALISVSDKTGIIEFARALHGAGVELLSTGGTAKALHDAGIAVVEIADYTGFAEMLDGRVKTLHPKVHAGILARRDSAEHMRALEQAAIPVIDLVVVNLYPFSQTIARADCPLAEAIENIDIGGPTMVRAAAKNYQHVAVVTDPADYSALVDEMQRAAGSLALRTRFALAKKAYSHTAAYDAAISNYLTALDDNDLPTRFPQRLNLTFEKIQDLRYGENPHQHAAFYRDLAPAPGSLSHYRQLQGKELSYNNIADADAAWECVKTFDAPACVIIKHANPCGVAIDQDSLAAYQRAFATDPTSAFGGIIAFNRALDAATAEAVAQQFAEVVIAPRIDEAALPALARKGNVRVLEVPLPDARDANAFNVARVGGGLLVQTPDAARIVKADLTIVSKRRPSPQQIDDMLFAWRVAKFVKSNAIVFCREGQTLGVGAGQMSRIDSARIAGIKAQNAGLALSGSVVASDAFFPFRDGIDVIAEAGAAAIIQPGGSLRDDEVIAAADQHGMVMAFTGVRHFRH
ncbi:MAG: bifunctional phosphoribosylaminoimidazolecarboxamide formyltransferase/IMP cyclohydrolase [Burkholderiales bacterium]|nr:bifunctional phosphoribosylaminoimidazolecarboxamide formyltransferase/IMP cyclohydrolase [Burkholderiales bacterium]MDQ3196670.1 bifunctional phosphoribosylaminoimidazolecarboxamide formyltransferase/IMP cyclohydrolase [Pseudomonadota bacterium]